MKGKRIVFLANTAWSMYNFRLGIMHMLRRRGADVTVIAPVDEYSDRFAESGIRFVEIKKLRAKGTNPLADLALFFELRRTLRSIRPHLMFSYTIKPNIYGILAAKSLNVPSIAVITGLGHGIAKGGFTTFVIERLYRFSLQRAVSTWFLNTEDQSYFHEKRIIRSSNSLVIPGEGIDMNHFMRIKPYPEQEPCKFLYIGRLLYEKGVSEFVQAIKLLKAAGENIVGELLGFADTSTPTSISLKTVKSWENEGIIRYLGHTADVRPFLEDTHCLVFPSYYNEGIPRVLLEAGSMEIPAITTDNVGCREVVTDLYTGFLCKPKNVESLASKMKVFLGLSYRERVDMGRNARRRVSERYSEEFIHHIYLDGIASMFNLNEKI